MESKVAVGLFKLAHGGTWWENGFSVGIAPSNALLYTRQVCEGIVDVLRQLFTHGKPTTYQVRKVHWRFACRRGTGMSAAL